jgi:hypothetical protein
MNRTERREKWTAAAELADLCRDMQPRVTYARNDSGEEFGESFPARCDREGMVECAIHWRGVR